jgi:hypothetical protein
LTELKQSDTPIFLDSGLPLKVLYLECHITLEPSDDRETLESIAATEEFKLAKLLMDKSLTKDMFMTGHAAPNNATSLTLRMLKLKSRLEVAGFKVTRSKK